MKMRALYCLFLIFCINTIGVAQKVHSDGKQTVYFDKDYNVVKNRTDATYSAVINKVDGKIVNPTTDYYLSGTIHWTGDVISCTDNEYIINGLCTWYDEKGIAAYQVEVSSNIWHGKFKSWWPNGKRKEKSVYVNGKKDGCEFQYDETGNCISGQLVVIEEEYKNNPNDQKFSKNCDCANKSTPAISSDGNSYGTGLVRDHMNGNLSTEESVLFKLLDDSKYGHPLIYLNFNFHETDMNNQKVANAVYHGLLNSKKIERIFANKYNEYLGEAIYYSMGYSIHQVHVADVDRTAAASGPRLAYTATIMCNVWVRDDKGQVLLNETFNGNTDLIGTMGFSYATQDEAISHSVQNLQNRITKHFKKKFSFD